MRNPSRTSFISAGRLLAISAVACVVTLLFLFPLLVITPDEVSARSGGIYGRSGAGTGSGGGLTCSGCHIISGSFTPVLEMGVGMHHELSVRENVFLYGAMIGFREEALTALFDEIIAFAELEDFVEAKVKELSTGMCQRLTFSVNAQLDTDLILLDEILAVGDRTFREKCDMVFKKRREDGKSLVLASHDLSAIASVCDVCILLDHGRQRAFGPTADVIELYDSDTRRSAAS